MKWGKFKFQIIASSLLMMTLFIAKSCTNPAENQQKCDDSYPGESAILSVHEEMYEELPHFVIETRDIIYYYCIKGGGFSKMVDRDGNDWIAFKREPWGKYPASAASSSRGIANLVYKGDDDGAGHPGHEQCHSWIENGVLYSESLSKKWKWKWDFFDSRVVFTMLRVDTNKAYWFLYEGKPGAKYRPEEYYFGTSSMLPRTFLPDFYKRKAIYGLFHWMFAGCKSSNKVLYMIQVENDDLPDVLGFLGNTTEGLYSSDGMAVFGFGRDQQTNPLLKKPHQFIIGLYPGQVLSNEAYFEFSGYINELIKQH